VSQYKKREVFLAIFCKKDQDFMCKRMRDPAIILAELTIAVNNHRVQTFQQLDERLLKIKERLRLQEVNRPAAVRTLNIKAIIRYARRPQKMRICKEFN